MSCKFHFLCRNTFPFSKMKNHLKSVTQEQLNLTFLFWNRVFHSSQSWVWTYYIAKDEFELLLPCNNFHHCEPPHPVYALLGALRMPGKYLTNWPTSAVQQLHFRVKCHFSTNYTQEYVEHILEIICKEKMNSRAEQSNEDRLLVDTKKVSTMMDSMWKERKTCLISSSFKVLEGVPSECHQATKLSLSLKKYRG